MNVCLSLYLRDAQWDIMNPKSCRCLPSTFRHSFVPSIFPCVGEWLPFCHTGRITSVSPLNSAILQEVNIWKARFGCAVPQTASGWEWLVVAGPVTWISLRMGITSLDHCPPLLECISQSVVLHLYVHSQYWHHGFLLSLTASWAGNKITATI